MQAAWPTHVQLGLSGDGIHWENEVSSNCTDFQEAFKTLDLQLTTATVKKNNAPSLAIPTPKLFHYFNKHDNILYANRFPLSPLELTTPPVASLAD